MGIHISLRHEIISDMCIPCTRFQFRYLDIRVGNSANLNLGINVVASKQPARFGNNWPFFDQVDSQSAVFRGYTLRSLRHEIIGDMFIRCKF